MPEFIIWRSICWASGSASESFDSSAVLLPVAAVDKEFEVKEAGGVVFASEIFLTGLYVEIFLI